MAGLLLHDHRKPWVHLVAALRDSQTLGGECEGPSPNLMGRRLNSAPMRTSALLAVLLLVTLAGCASKPTAQVTSTSSSAGLRCADASKSSDCANHVDTGNDTVVAAKYPKGTPVNIHETGDLQQGGSHAWNWTVGSDFDRFTVTLTLAGPQGTPQYTLTQENIVLVGGTPSDTRFAQSTTVGSGTGGTCLICFDGTDTTGPYGPWRLGLDAGPSLATYTVDIIVTYK